MATKKVLLRIDEDLHKSVKDAAELASTSINSIIVQAIAGYVDALKVDLTPVSTGTWTVNAASTSNAHTHGFTFSDGSSGHSHLLRSARSNYAASLVQSLPPAEKTELEKAIELLAGTKKEDPS